MECGTSGSTCQTELKPEGKTCELGTGSGEGVGQAGLAFHGVPQSFVHPRPQQHSSDGQTEDMVRSFRGSQCHPCWPRDYGKGGSDFPGG